ncbi:MAG: ABC transporter ATP-binding protein [Nitrospirae bacterium]|nr:ABC transporter ATP-binding protein [Nitrospirota bacterium]
MLRLENIYTSYGLVEVLKGISLEVREGEIVCLIGANGAGKSTTLMTISGVNRVDSGDIHFRDVKITGLPVHDVVQRGIAHVPEGRRIFPKMTVFENLEIGAYSCRKTDIQTGLERAYTYFPLLKERSRQLGGTLSGGEQQMLAIARALMANPKLLLLDEPSLGLAPIIARRIFEIIREINREGVTILLVEQNAKTALHLADRGYVMETGKIVMADRSETLLHDPRVREAYLGE